MGGVYPQRIPGQSPETFPSVRCSRVPLRDRCSRPCRQGSAFVSLPTSRQTLALKAEIEAAKAVRCPIHGDRFSELAPTIYVAAQFRHPTHLHPERWMGASRQYVKAMEASFPADRWPAQEIVDPDDSVRFVLKDGTEIHRISPPPLVYDVATGEPCRRIGRDGKILPLSPPMAEAEVVPPLMCFLGTAYLGGRRNSPAADNPTSSCGATCCSRPYRSKIRDHPQG
jgi:hypothetical protein